LFFQLSRQHFALLQAKHLRTLLLRKQRLHRVLELSEVDLQNEDSRELKINKRRDFRAEKILAFAYARKNLLLHA
jgi:hypothetical protein